MSPYGTPVQLSNPFSTPMLRTSPPRPPAASPPAPRPVLVEVAEDEEEGEEGEERTVDEEGEKGKAGEKEARDETGGEGDETPAASSETPHEIPMFNLDIRLMVLPTPISLVILSCLVFAVVSLCLSKIVSV